jgi:HAD superfamily hydrolase (TIGR01509 family)
MKSSDSDQSFRVILFDLGGVLIENAGREGLMALLPYELDRSLLLERWLASPAVKRFESGLIPPHTFAAEFIMEWRLEIGPAEFIDAFATWPQGFFDGAKTLVQALRMQHHVACLSNTNSVHWARFPDLPGLFDSVFASHLTGLIKPDREAYEHILRQLNVPADAVYFFDDLLPNIDAARAVGINAFHVRAFSEIELTLRAEGLYT